MRYLTLLIILSFASFLLGVFWENLTDLERVSPVDYSTAYTSRPQSLEVLSTENLPECGLESTPNGAYCYRVESDYIECDTDEDCYNKNGCGGYADPCIQGE